MAVDAAEFTKKGGLLNTKALWPGVSTSEIAAKFAAWLEDGAARTADFTDATKDDGTRLVVRDRAWDDVYQIRLGNPASVSVDQEGSSGYTQGQIDAAREERDAARAEFAALLEAQPDDTPEPITRQSANARSEVLW